MKSLARLAVICCVMALAACGGGGGGGDNSGGGAGGGGGGGPPPDPDALRPRLFIETESDGTVFLRVLEHAYNPFATPPAVTVQNLTTYPGDIVGSQTVRVENVHLTNQKYGLHLLGSGIVSIYDFSYDGFDGGGSIHGAGIKIERTGAAATYIQRAFADGHQAPDPTYNVSNTDFIGIEFNGAPVYVRNATGRNFGDAGVDSKSTSIYLMNVSISGVLRALRAWDGVEIVLANSIVNVPAGSAHAWIHDNSSTIRYYNTIWCVGAANPSPTDPNCSATPSLVEGEDISDAQALARMIEVSSNPLPAVSPFFETEIDRIVVEYSSNGGSSWSPLNLPNTGGAGRDPIGDTRYEIPLNLAAGTYLFRAHFEKSGAQVGEVSAVINEAGEIVS